MARHRRDRCMEKNCNKPPEREILHAEGRARAWFCVPHRDTWDTKNPYDIVDERSVSTEVSKSW